MKSHAVRGIKAFLLKAPKILPKARSVDRAFALIQFFKAHRRLPKTSGGSFNDALFFIKSSDEILDPVRVFVSDKALLKDYVKAKIGDACNVDTIAVLDTFDDAVSFAYPANCVIKPTHLSGEIIFRRNGSSVDFEKINSWFTTNFYDQYRETNYRYLRSRVIVEPYIFDQEAVEDYKIFCLHGRPIVVQVDFNRHTHHTQNLYTADWEPLPFAISCPIGEGRLRPDNLDRLLDVAAKLSDEFNLIRIDLYTDGRDVLVGEITNCHQGARGRFVPPEGEKIMTCLLFGESGFSPAVLKAKSTGSRTGAKD
jgi:hypothetical protein